MLEMCPRCGHYSLHAETEKARLTPNRSHAFLADTVALRLQFVCKLSLKEPGAARRNNSGEEHESFHRLSCSSWWPSSSS
jgi:hypothetical protein